MRYQVHDDEGVLRTFSRKEEAVAFMATRPALKLVVVRQQRKKKGELTRVEEAPS